MNDQINNNTKPKNITELFNMFLKTVTELYDAVVPASVKNRKNKEKAKISDPEIITIYLLIQCLGMSINKGYNFLKKILEKVFLYARMVLEINIRKMYSHLFFSGL